VITLFKINTDHYTFRSTTTTTQPPRTVQFVSKAPNLPNRINRLRRAYAAIKRGKNVVEEKTRLRPDDFRFRIIFGYSRRTVASHRRVATGHLRRVVDGYRKVGSKHCSS
jgi:hypothetical protein